MGLSIDGNVVHGIARGGQPFYSLNKNSDSLTINGKIYRATNNDKDIKFVTSAGENSANLTFNNLKKLNIQSKFFIIAIYSLTNSIGLFELYITKPFSLDDTSSGFFFMSESKEEASLSGLNLNLQDEKLTVEFNHNGIYNPTNDRVDAYLFQLGG